MRSRRRGWFDAVVLPTWEVARAFLIPGAALWTLYEISGRFRTDESATKDAFARDRSEATAAALSAFVAVGVVGGSAWWYLNGRRVEA